MATSSLRDGSPSLIDDLPNENLGGLFYHYVVQDLSPWLLVLVCKKWNRVAMTEGRLWTHIIVNDKGYGVDTKWVVFGVAAFSQGRASVCHDVGEFRATVGRTGVLPLHIRVVLGYKGGYVGAMTLLVEVLSPDITMRTVELHFSCIVHSKFFAQVPVFGAFPALKVLHINEIPNPWICNFLEEIYSSSGNSLRSFQLPKSTTEPYRHMVNLLTRLDNLEQFRNWPQGWPPGWPLKNRLSIKVPLTELQISCEPISLFQLEFPRLRSLDIFDMGMSQLHNYETTRPLNLPRLDKLLAKTRCVKWIEFVSAPRLRTFTLTGVDRPSRTHPEVHLLSANLFPMVEELSYKARVNEPQQSDPEDTLIITTLQAVPNANSVKIKVWSEYDGDGKLRRPLLERMASMHEHEVICPKLRELRLVSLSWPWVTQKPLAEEEAKLVQQVVDIRHRMGRGLHRCLVKWRDPEGNITTRRFVLGTTNCPLYVLPKEE